MNHIRPWRGSARFALLLLCLLAGAGVELDPVSGEDEAEPAPAWFQNVAPGSGLQDAKAKSAAFVDLDGDGWLDLCLDRHRLYRSAGGGARFESLPANWIPTPEIDFVPVGKDGTADAEKARTRPYVPHYLYFADVDNDGRQDAIYGVKAHWLHFDGQGSFKPVTGSDHGVRTRVLLAKAEGGFRQAPASAFTHEAAVGSRMALAPVDTNADGRLDLFEGREYVQYGVLYGCGVDRLWRGDGRGGFEDVTKASGLETVPTPARDDSSRPTYGVTHADWNGDGHVDLLALSYGRQWNRLWKNRGDGTFEDVGRATLFAGDTITHGRYPDWIKKRTGRPDEQPFRSNGNTFDCAVGDIDGDGDLDFFLGEIAHFWAGESSDLPALLVNQGAARQFAFVRKTVKEFLPERKFRHERWNYGDLHTAMADFDNDGRLDLLIGSGDYPDGQFLRLYHQQTDGTFTEVTEIAGFDWEGCGGISLGDYDRDGDVDILAGRSFMRLNKAHREKYMGGIEVNHVGLFRNDHANRTGHHWLVVKLRGKGAGGSNRDGIGARVTVTAGDKQYVREMRRSAGLANHQDALELHFGLGGATQVERVEVRWCRADREAQVFRKVPIDQHVLLAEDASEAHVLGK